jgi:flagellar motor protein MotB
MKLTLASLLLLSALQPAPVLPGVEPLEPRACGGFWSILFFDSDSSELSAASRAILDNMLGALHSNNYTSRVRLVGHADRVGRPEANLALSRRRALAVRDYLVAHGVAAGLISAEGRSEEQVLVETADGVAEAQNRRVEIMELVPDEIVARWNAWIRLHGPRPGPIC